MPKRGFEPLASPAANHYTTIDLQQNWKQYITARLSVFLKSVSTLTWRLFNDFL